ncbi:ArsR/SmtB family transcription factor [Phytohabitans suffuscus]|uniref:HTH arsR-type domain-containing protein n=1 Tax=Phytohabitans suffuscus TaxID=624315 RepID=A0A6F8YTY9_9ACTN|nr:metalloregulator ArsR/SmtB family transcription factor [Phytohabitans suffuscus]BCB89301.1 hypothetical protein Psuf_066140 [Phytohabitans suffuscus]
MDLIARYVVEHVFDGLVPPPAELGWRGQGSAPLLDACYRPISSYPWVAKWLLMHGPAFPSLLPIVETGVSVLLWAAGVHTSLPDFRMPNEEQVHLAAEGFRLLADPTRIKILWVLLQGESSVACLAELVGAAPTAVSQHLAKLRLAGLVRGAAASGTSRTYSG